MRKEPDFVFDGDYMLRDAKRLMAALAAARIEFRADFHDGISTESGSMGRAFGLAARIGISVDARKLDAAEQIKARLFAEESSR
jgi:hypothetical protein